MNLQDITEDILLKEPNVRSVDFEHEWYFVASDMNKRFMGAFNNVPGLPLPILVNGNRELLKCISFHDIQQQINFLAGKSDFERHINTALNFNPKKK
ncbi:hypothetical protein [Flavobacterium sp.]|uniref:hypothetical protein n=1 Tax=Flavobacterium sp. TaxID=239 RepID=UPI003A8D7181